MHDLATFAFWDFVAHIPHCKCTQLDRLYEAANRFSPLWMLDLGCPSLTPSDPFVLVRDALTRSHFDDFNTNHSQHTEAMYQITTDLSLNER